MSRHRLRRRSEKARRHAVPAFDGDVSRVVVREAPDVERLVYTRAQAAAALDISRSTFIRRVLPFVETVEMGWGTRLVPVDEVERFVAEHRRKAQAQRRPAARPGRRIGIPVEVVTRIRDEHADGRSLAEIARALNADGVPTSQGGVRGGRRRCGPFSSARLRRSPPADVRARRVRGQAPRQGQSRSR